MAYLRPSGDAVAEAINLLRRKPGGFQRLAEHYVALQFPDEFDPLTPSGRTADDATRTNWPDAFARSPKPDGRFSLLEVTADQKNWRQHVLGDLEAAAVVERRVERLTVVLWIRSPDFQEVEEVEEDLASTAGLAPSRCRLVFRERLVEDLRQPRFARVRSDPTLLGLRISTTHPFAPLTDAGLFGDEERPGAFAPSHGEYESGRVEVGPAEDRITARLAERGWALVLGRSGAGKTVLATSIALRRTVRGDLFQDSMAETYYLRLGTLSSEADRARALDVFTEAIDDQLMTIVDDVHLDGVTA
jgi:hypothetical protein